MLPGRAISPRPAPALGHGQVFGSITYVRPYRQPTTSLTSTHTTTNNNDDSALLRGLLHPPTDDDPTTTVLAPTDARLYRGFLPAATHATTPPNWVQSTPEFQLFAARVHQAAGQFDCGAGETIPLGAVNDGFCQCRSSAVDEPGTAACSGQAPGARGPAPSFLCRMRVGGGGGGGEEGVGLGGGQRWKGRRWNGEGKGGEASRPSSSLQGDGRLPDGFIWLPASKVGDGIVDCACGEDEGLFLCDNEEEKEDVVEQP